MGNNLDTKICGDNCNTNFGDGKRQAKNNVITHLQVGCYRVTDEVQYVHLKNLRISQKFAY